MKEKPKVNPKVRMGVTGRKAGRGKAKAVVKSK